MAVLQNVNQLVARVMHIIIQHFDVVRGIEIQAMVKVGNLQTLNPPIRCIRPLPPATISRPFNMRLMSRKRRNCRIRPAVPAGPCTVKLVPMLYGLLAFLM